MHATHSCCHGWVQRLDWTTGLNKVPRASSGGQKLNVLINSVSLLKLLPSLFQTHCWIFFRGQRLCAYSAMSFNQMIEKCPFCYLWFNKASWNKSAPLILSGAKQAKHFQLKAWRRCFPSKYIHVGNSGCNSWMLKACRVSSHLHGSSHSHQSLM